jgi:integrase
MAARKDRKKGWVVDFVFQHADGKSSRVRRRSPVQTRRGAEDYERQLRQELLNPTPVRKEVPTFARFVAERWLPVYPGAAGNRPSTVHEKESHVRLYLNPALGSLRLDAVRGEQVDRLFAGLRRRGLSPKTCRNVRATLRRILASAVEWDLIESIPPLPKIKVPDSSFDFLTREEGELLVGSCQHAEVRTLLLFALHTGARAGEQLAVEWGDVDFASRQVVFRRSSTRGVVGPTKSGRERRVPLTARLHAALRSHRHLRGPRVFCNADGSPLSIWQLHERLWAACRRAGLRKIRWHDQRHSFASQLVIAGVPLRQVQEWLGHSTIAMTMRYSHLAPGSGQEMIGALEAPARKTTSAWHYIGTPPRADRQPIGSTEER